MFNLIAQLVEKLSYFVNSLYLFLVVYYLFLLYLYGVLIEIFNYHIGTWNRVPSINSRLMIMLFILLYFAIIKYVERKISFLINWAHDNYFEHRVSEWLRCLTVDRSTCVRELAWANKCMHQSSFMKVTIHIENLHLVAELGLNLYH